MTHSQESDDLTPTPETQESGQSPETEPTPAAQTELADAMESAATTEAQLPAPKPSVVKPSAVKPSAVKPSALKPSALGAVKQAAQVAPVVPAFSTDVSVAAQYAEVSDEGHVTLLDGDERIEVGQVPGASKDEALAYYVRKYDDVMTQVLLLEQRLTTDAATSDLEKALNPIQQSVEQRLFVGDVSALRAKVTALQTSLAERREQEKTAREEALTEQREAREKIVADAEQLAAQDPNKVHWKNSSQAMNELFETWRTLQKQGPRLPRPEEDELWKRFRAARNSFDKERKSHFATLDAQTAEAKQIKEKLISRAEALQESTDWATTSAKYRDLMKEWKAAPRASRKEDDALWKRFRAAQDVFFNSRQAANDEVEREFTQNLKVKEEILAEGQKLLPFTDVQKARAAMNDLRGRWEDAGKVPRNDIARMDAGFRKLEKALQDAEDEHWSRTNPETKARTNSMVTQLEETIAGLERDLADAEAAGDAKKIAKAQEALDARRSWLEVVKASGQ